MTKTKVCKVCGIEKEINQFGISHRKNKKPCIRNYCRLCGNEKTRKHYANNLNKYREYNLKNKFGISLNEYNNLLELQNFQCAICGSKDTKIKKSKYFSVDHDHKNGEVRGLLCHHCNVGLGHFQDNPTILFKAVDYLMRFQSGLG